jgi:uncharacterized membrane protein YfcA
MASMGNSPAPSIRFGYVLVGAAFLVEGSRLVLTTLAAGRRPVSPDTEQFLLVVAAVAMAVVLMGGVTYLAHAALTAPRWRIALGITWALVLGASAGMELHEVVSAPGLRLAWALLAALAHGLTATGCILAAVASQPPGSSSDPFLCQGCGRAFASKQARGGHQRSCPARGLALPASR